LSVTRRIVFIGDSITDCDHFGDLPDQLGNGYVRMIAERLPDHEVVNAGISGNRIGDLRGRWERDVVDRHPDTLSVYIGINDTWRRFDENDPTTASFFEDTYRDCLADLGGAGLLVLLEPFVVPVSDDQERWREDLGKKQAVVAKLAAEHGARFVPLQSLLSSAADKHGAVVVADDGVHPTELGHRIIADAWLDSAGL
jgi:lysophospholipase L1-like esterase